MKKLFLSFAVIAGMSMISCGGNSENATNDADTAAVEEVAVEEVAVETPDSAAVAVEADSAAVEAPAAE